MTFNSALEANGAWHRGTRTALAVLAVLQIYGIFFSIALSSVAFTSACVLFAVMIWRERKGVLEGTGLEWYFLAYIVSLLLMVACARYPWASLYHVRRVLLIVGVYFLPVALESPRRLRHFIIGLAILVGVQSIGDIVLSSISDRARVGFFQHYMTSAGMKMMVLLFVVPMLFTPALGRRTRAVLAACVIVTTVALVMTQTRSSWLGALAGLLVIGALQHRTVLAGIAVVVVAFMLLAPAPLKERVRHMFTTQSATEQTPTIASNTSRMRMWRTGWRMFLERPLTGMGEGEMWTMYRGYVPDAPDDEGGHLHNSYIHALATGGIVGFAALMALLFGVARLEWHAWRTGGGVTRSVALGAMAVFIGVGVNGLAEYNLADHEILVLLWTTVGLVIAASRLDRAANAERVA
jgi:O-antigen ligase